MQKRKHKDSIQTFVELNEEDIEYSSISDPIKLLFCKMLERALFDLHSCREDRKSALLWFKDRQISYLPEGISFRDCDDYIGLTESQIGHIDRECLKAYKIGYNTTEDSLIIEESPEEFDPWPEP